jgi:hypothetical protein
MRDPKTVISLAGVSVLVLQPIAVMVLGSPEGRNRAQKHSGAGLAGPKRRSTFESTSLSSIYQTLEYSMSQC